jgi:hypothetical protein
MSPHIRHLFHAYTSRRSPWGPPWCIYGVSFGAATLLRHTITLMNPEIPQTLRVLTWLASALVVVVVVNGVAIVLRAIGDAPQTLTPLWPLRRGHDRAEATDPSPPGSDRPPRRHPKSSRWAPWWLYILVIVGMTHLRRVVGVDGSTPAARVVIALAVSATLFVTITAGYRAFVHRAASPRE